MEIYLYDYEFEKRDGIIKLLAHKLEKLTAKRIYNKNKNYNKRMKMSLKDAIATAQTEVQWLLDNVDKEMEVEHNNQLRIADDGRLN